MIVDLDDEKVYNLINKGLLSYVFQLDGGANRHVIKEIGGIYNFEDIVSVSSLVRPGSAQFIPVFKHNKQHGIGKYPTKRLAPILDSTNGVILYQEQVMYIAQRLAKFNMIQVDDIKELIKAKDREKFDKVKPVFIKGCIENGLKDKVAQEVWKMIEDASGYLYNRSHAVSYSLLTYMTAYLKAYHPVQFFAAAMNIVAENRKKELYSDALEMGIEFIRPSVAKSETLCTIEKDKIRIGLSLIKGIGEKTSVAFTETRNKSSVKEAMNVLPKRVVGAVMQKALRESGAYGNKETDSINQSKRLGFSLD